jgi:Flp pilus assembly protein TadG
MTRRRRSRHDRGSESVELAILLPIGILVLAFIVVGARIVLASDRMSGVAGIAARDASIARSPDSAQSIARTSAEQALGSDDLHCTGIRVIVDTSGFAAAPDTNPSIHVEVWCTVDLSDIGVTGLPGAKTLHDSATSPLDPARDIGLGFGNSEVRIGASRRGGVSDASV